jgi:hypothetical protein
MVPPARTIPRSSVTIRMIAFRVEAGSDQNRFHARLIGVFPRDPVTFGTSGAAGAELVTWRAYEVSATTAAGTGVASTGTCAGRPSLMSIDSSQRRMLR